MYLEYKQGCKLIQPKAEHLKYWLFYYYRIKRQFHYCASEVMVGWRWIADFIVCTNKDITEIEIKVSIADLKNDIVHKKYKFECLKDIREDKKLFMYDKEMIPNYFYYCVPEKIAIKAYEYLKDTPYGLIIIPNHHYNDSDFFWIKQSSERFNKEYPNKLKEKIVARMSSEILGLREKILKMKNEYDIVSDKHYRFSIDAMKSIDLSE